MKSNFPVFMQLWKCCISLVRSDAYKGNFRYLMRAVPHAIPFFNFSFAIRIFFKNLFAYCLGQFYIQIATYLLKCFYSNRTHDLPL